MGREPNLCVVDLVEKRFPARSPAGRCHLGLDWSHIEYGTRISITLDDPHIISTCIYIYIYIYTQIFMFIYMITYIYIYIFIHIASIVFPIWYPHWGQPFVAPGLLALLSGYPVLRAHLTNYFPLLSDKNIRDPTKSQ